MLQTFDTANMSWNSDKKIFTFNVKMMILIFFASSRDDDLDFCDIDSIKDSIAYQGIIQVTSIP
jgi:hypothetical protein